MAKADPTTPATKALQRAGITWTSHSYDHDPRHGLSYGSEAAQALGLDPALVHKTLVVAVTGLARPGLAVAVIPVSRTLNLKAMAAALGHKHAELADPAAAQRSSGYVVGGISPIGQRTALPTVIDQAAQELPTIYVSGGRRGLDLGLAPADLAAITSARWAAITS